MPSKPKSLALAVRIEVSVVIAMAGSPGPQEGLIQNTDKLSRDVLAIRRAAPVSAQQQFAAGLQRVRDRLGCGNQGVFTFGQQLLLGLDASCDVTAQSLAGGWSNTEPIILRIYCAASTRLSATRSRSTRRLHIRAHNRSGPGSYALRSSCQVDIARLIANHERARRSKPKSSGGPLREQRLRFAAVAMIFGHMRAVIKRVDLNSSRGQPPFVVRRECRPASPRVSFPRAMPD